MTHRHKDANWKANEFQCECCGHNLGVRIDRGCTWSYRFMSWFSACRVCADYIHQDNRDLRFKPWIEPPEPTDYRWLHLVGAIDGHRCI